MKVREAVPALTITGVAKPEEWEGKGQAKVYGKLQKGDVNWIVLTDDKGKEMAKIIVDSVSTYSNYYIQKLRLFDTFWFYLNVKDSVDKRRPAPGPRRSSTPTSSAPASTDRPSSDDTGTALRGRPFFLPEEGRKRGDRRFEGARELDRQDPPSLSPPGPARPPGPGP